MNKKLLRVALLVAVVAVAGLGVHKAQAKKPVLSDIMLANVEALSSSENHDQGFCSQKCNDGIGRCWLRSSGGYCVMTGDLNDYCTKLPCRTVSGDFYY